MIEIDIWRSFEIHEEVLTIQRQWKSSSISSSKILFTPVAFRTGVNSSQWCRVEWATAQNTKNSTLPLKLFNEQHPWSSQQPQKNTATTNGSPSRHRLAWNNASDLTQTQSAASSMQQWNRKATHSACEDLRLTELSKTYDWIWRASKR